MSAHASASRWSALFTSLLAAGALAQTAVPGFELERLRLNPGAREGLLVDSADLLGRFEYRAALGFGYQKDALVVVSDGKRLGTLVGDRATLHVWGAFAPTDWLELGLQVPIVLMQAGDGASTTGYQPVFTGVAMDTPWISAKGGILQERRGNPLEVSVGLGLGLPLGYGGALSADQSVSGFVSAAAGKRFAGLLHAGGSVTGLLRNARALSTATLGSDEVGSLLSLGAILNTTNDGLRGELSARVDVPFTHTGVGAEVDLGVRYLLFNALELYAAGGPGFGKLPGTPAFRLFAGLAYAPRTPPAPPKPACVEDSDYALKDCPALDKDHDGVANGADRCPTVPGVSTQGGCPDKDSDGDGVLDAADACPDVAGLERLKGCPEPDADKDGVPDASDACPAAPGPAASRGCPDTDGDGLDDSVDACPKEAGLAELKGCPDVDTDGDGVPDRVDACRTEKGVPENAGCPAKKKQLVVITKDKLVIKEKVRFAYGKASLLPDSFALLRQVSTILKEHPEVGHLNIEGHTDDRGTREQNVKLSEARAAAVRDWLVKDGVDAARLSATGFGPDRPLDSNLTEKGREANRRVEFIIAGVDVTP